MPRGRRVGCDADDMDHHADWDEMTDEHERLGEAMATVLKAEGLDGSALVATDVAAYLRRAILSRRARVGIIGLGYVGLPLGVVFAETGFETIGFELDAARVAGLNAGRSHIPD